MNKKIIPALLVLPLLGCFEDQNQITEPSQPELPNPEPEIPEVTYQGNLRIKDTLLTGAIVCNGEPVGDDGVFSYTSSDETIMCEYGPNDLGTFPNNIAAQLRTGAQPQENTQTFTFDKFTGIALDNVYKLLEKASDCPTEKALKFCLQAAKAFDIQPYFGSENEAEVDAFIAGYKPSTEGEGDTVVADGKLPSAHQDPELQPEVTPGTKPELSANFVSASAERAYSYTPSSAENKPLTVSSLTDSAGNPVVGVEYFSESAKGMTGADGEFEYLWGENLIFGIDTFTLGEVKGNKVDYTLANLSENPLVQQNIESLLQRYDTDTGAAIEIGDKVRQVFAQYPNVINELINLNLANGAQIEGTSFVTPNEFEEQFSQGLTQVIDAELNTVAGSRDYEIKQISLAPKGGYVTDSLQQIYAGVDKVHVFHDNQGWGGSGYARAMRNFNLTNEAFPVLMPRNDNSYWLDYGQEAAWTRGGGKDKKAYIVDATTLDAASTVVMQRPPIISKETATFNLPTMAAGSIGKGKVVFLGNAMYTSIFSCPDNYWAGADLGIDASEQSCRYGTPHNQAKQDADSRNDHGSMAMMFTNLVDWLVPGATEKNIAIATNIDKGHAFKVNVVQGQVYDFFVNPSYQLGELQHVSSGGFDALNPETTPLLFMQSFEVKAEGYDSKSVVSDTTKPKLTAEDVTALIKYVNGGGNMIFFDALEQNNPEPIARLADAAGVSIGGANLARTFQSYCGEGYWCHNAENLNVPNQHTLAEHDIVVYERYGDTSKIVINEDGTITWPGDVDMPSLEIPKYMVGIEGGEKARYAFHIVKTPEQKQAAIEELQAAFPGVPLCKDAYEYEVNCIETRKGHGIPSRGNHHRPDFSRYAMSPEIVDSMVKAANLGANIDALLAHELYYRTKGKKGTRLPEAELTTTYDNLSVWLWNDEQYEFNPAVQDELGFERAVELLNCYTNDSHGGGSLCTEATRAELMDNAMLTADGELNPSYPLNWMEKPLTRMMLGRSYWDLDISVDTKNYPGRPDSSTTAASVSIHTDNKTVIGTAGSMQSTGLWAPQRQAVSISGGVKASINVALVDNITGRSQHELALKRPPRVQKTFQYDGSSLTFEVPYGGLIYITPKQTAADDVVTYDFSGVMKASLWKDGHWVNPVNTDVPLAEIDTGHFIYTTPVQNVANLSNEEIQQFVTEMNDFANHASDFYGRDQQTAQGGHRRFTYDALLGNRHRFVNDVQISIGAAHSGYPVQSTTYNKNASTIPTKPTDDWLLWHEVGHNLAAAPFVMAGSTEVTNNILALYMQEQRASKPYMSRIYGDLVMTPHWIKQHEGHAWSEGSAGMRLAMFGQLKLWAEEHFNINDWYASNEKPVIFGEDQGWNLFKLAHRKARGDRVGDQGKNYCSAQASGLAQGDLLMACTSYLTGYDLSEYFKAWNPSESKADLPSGESSYSGGLTSAGFDAVSAMNLPKPKKSPSAYLSVK